MHKNLRVVWTLGALALAPVTTPAAGQAPMGPTRQAGVEFLLARTGTLQLTDQQVVKLAAIARRAADRHKAMHLSFDSLRTQMRSGGDSAGRERHRFGPPPQLVAAMQKEREAAHADLRDAIAVLTPDQQAHAWELVSERRSHMTMRVRRDGPSSHMRPGMPMHRDGAMMSGHGDDDDDADAMAVPDNGEDFSVVDFDR